MRGSSVPADNAALAREKIHGRPGRHGLDLRVGLIDEVGLPDYRPVVRILIDGRELLAGPRGDSEDRYYGSPPAALVDGDVPLLQGQWARRLVLYICGCGVPADRCIAPVIRASDGTVRWTDFRQCWDGPGIEPPVLELYPQASRPINIADLVFDHEQYFAEVQRVAAARESESNRRRIARRPKARLSRFAA